MDFIGMVKKIVIQLKEDSWLMDVTGMVKIISYLFRAGNHIDIILQQGMEISHMEIVELSFIWEH